MLDPVERRGPCLTSPISARLISHQSERDRSMEVGNYPTEGWRFWALLAGIAMIGLLGLVMAPSTWGGAWRRGSGRVGGRHDPRSQVPLRRLPLSRRGHQPRRLALLPLS